MLVGVWKSWTKCVFWAAWRRVLCMGTVPLPTAICRGNGGIGQAPFSHLYMQGLGGGAHLAPCI